MIKLFVAVVGSNDITPVSVDGSSSVGDLKEAIAAKLPYSVPALRLELYRANRDGQWLSSQATSLKELQRPTFSRDSPYLVAEMDPTSLVSRHYPSDTPRSEVIHVLALLPIVGTPRSIAQLEAEGTILPSPRPLQRPALSTPWVRASEPCPQLHYGKQPFVSIPWHYLENSGLQDTQPGQDLWVYRRRALREQWDEMERDSVDAEAMLWIVGAPGAGKSCAAYAFACGVVDRTRWNVLWIHYEGAKKALHCVKFEGDVKSTCKLYTKSLSTGDFDILLASCVAKPGLFVLLDGYRKDDRSGYCNCVLDDLVFWQRRDPRHRRLVCVASMSSLGKDYNTAKYKKLVKPPTTKPSRQNGKLSLFDTMEFKLSSWTLDEYLAAVQHGEFFRSIMAAFGVETDPGVKGRRELVEDKYYVAGGSARLMFAYTTEDASTTLVKALDAVNNPQSYADGHVGGGSAGAVNRLIAHYDVGEGDTAEFRTSIVSAFALRQLALRLGPATIINFAKYLDVNPAMDGHLFEAWVVASLAYGELEYRVQKAPDKPLRWKQCQRESFDPTKNVITDVNRYFLPTKWNQAGYDAVYIVLDDAEDPPRLRYIFLQITRATTHSFTPDPFVDVLHMLGENKRNVGAVELWFVVPRPILERFSKRDVDSLFRKNVVDVAFPESSRRGEVESVVDIVGVDYPYDRP